MSDVSQGPGWWLASDGRWYPPESRPVGQVETEAPSGSTTPQGPGWWLASDRRWYPPTLRADVSPPQPRSQPQLQPRPQRPPERARAVPEGAGRETAPPSTLPRLPEHPRRGIRAARPRRKVLAVGGLGLLAVVLVVVVALVVTRTTGPTTPTTVPPTASGVPALAPSGGWTVPGARVLGGPVLSGGTLLAVVTTGGETLSLEALDPATGRVRWQVPYSASEINAGIVLTPSASSGVVVDLAPAGAATTTGVVVEGIAVTTGRVQWTMAGARLVTDTPSTCTGQRLFCVDEIDAQGSSALVLLQPSSGSVVATVPGLYRELAPDYYETDGSPVAIESLDSAGRSAWMVPVQSIFGSSTFSPDYGWNFAREGALELGSVGIALSGVEVPLDQYKTVAVRASDGTVAWEVAGSYQCMGVVEVTAPFVCRYGGSGRLVGQGVTTSGATLTIEGIDPESGSVRWSAPVADAQQFTQGDDVVVAGTDLVVVALSSGSEVLLDLSDGSRASVPRGATYWCSSIPAFPVVAPPAALANGGRTGVTLYSPCTAAGAASAGLPSVAPGNVGIDVSGLFVWAGPEGLRALPLAH